LETKKQQAAARAKRLGTLIKKAGGQADFCRHVWPREPADANKAKVSKWYRSGSGIHPDQAVEIAEAFKVRAAWLLWGELPERESVTRTEAKLADDMAAYVQQELDRLVTPSAIGEQGQWVVYGHRVLQMAVDHAWRRARWLVNASDDPEGTVGLMLIESAKTPTKRRKP
jgi:hypothetical protein